MLVFAVLLTYVCEYNTGFASYRGSDGRNFYSYDGAKFLACRHTQVLMADLSAYGGLNL